MSMRYKFRTTGGDIIFVPANSTDLSFRDGSAHIDTAAIGHYELDSRLITQDRWEKTLLATHGRVFAYVDFTREDGVWMHVRGSEPIRIKGTELSATTLSPDLIDKAKAALASNDDITVKVD